MRIEIDSSGNLNIDRGGVMKRQWCPYSHESETQCGDWCPLFSEPEYGNNGRVILELCTTVLTVRGADFSDMRWKDGGK